MTGTILVVLVRAFIAGAGRYWLLILPTEKCGTSRVCILNRLGQVQDWGVQQKLKRAKSDDTRTAMTCTTTTIVIIIRKCDQERRRYGCKIQISHKWNSSHVVFASKSDTSDNRGGWNHFKITRAIPEQHSRISKIKEMQKKPYWVLNTYCGKC